MAAPYKVEGRAVHNGHPDLFGAEANAAFIAQRGGQAAVRYAPPGGAEPVTVARFGPDQAHSVSVAGDGALQCSCGRRANDQCDIVEHLTHAGHCWFCWGTCYVAGAPGTFLAGTTLECPVCDGNGQALGADLGENDLTLYASAHAELTATTPQEGR